MTTSRFKSTLTLAVCSVVMIGLAGCNILNPRAPHAGGIYQIETSDLQKALSIEDNERFLPPVRILPNNNTPVLHTYVLLKVYTLDAEGVNLKFTPQESELLMTDKTISDETFSKFTTLPAHVSREAFEMLTPKLQWITNGKTDDWQTP